MNDDTNLIENALHAAATWLDRIEAPAGSAAVLDVLPTTRAGCFTPPATTVRWYPLDDTATEVCEATAPVVDAGLRRLDADVLRRLNESIAEDDARLQAVIAPDRRGVLLRLVRDGTAVELGRVELVDEPANLH